MSKSLLILFACYFISEAIDKYIGLNIPSAIVGLLLLFLLLKSGIIKPNQVEPGASFFLKTMPFYFIPAGVGLILYFELIKPYLFILLLAAFLSTAVSMVITAYIHQAIRNSNKAKVL